MKKKPENYRLRITSPDIRNKSSSYITRYGERVSYISGSETPLALSNLILDDAAAVRFALEDAEDGADAAVVVRKALAKQYANNKPLTPVVEVV